MDWGYLYRWEFLLVSLPLLLLAIWELSAVRREIRRSRAAMAREAAPIPPASDISPKIAELPRDVPGKRADDSAWRRPGSG